MLRYYLRLTFLIGAYLAAPEAHAASAAAYDEHLIDPIQELFYRGDHEQAREEAERLLEDPNLEPETRIEALRLRAFTLFATDELQEAEQTWRRLLELDPDYELDPMIVSPELVDFFGAVLPPEDTPHAKVYLPSASTARRRKQEQARQQSEATAPAKPPPSDLDLDAAPKRGCGVWLCLVPFGVGQFANDNLLKGVLFAVLEVAALATNISLYWVQRPTTPPSDAHLGAQHAAFGLFSAAVVLGVVDAFVFP